MRNWAWYIANLVNFLALCCHLSSTLLPLYWKQAGFEDWQIGWLAASFSTAAIMARVGLGYGLQRFGRKPFLLLGAILLNATAGLYGYMGDDFFHWMGLRAIQGVGLACYITAILTWVADRSPPERIGQLQGIFGVSGLLGAAAGPFTAEQIYRAHGFQSMFDAIFVAGLVCSLLVATLPESEHIEAESHTSSSINIWSFKAMVFVTLPFGWLTGTVITFIAPFVEVVGLKQVGLYFAGFSVASVCVRVFAAESIDRLKSDTLVSMSGGALALGAFSISALAVAPQTELLLVAAVLNGLGHGFLFPGLATYIVRQTNRAQRGSGLALFTGTFDVGILFGGLVSGYVSQDVGYAGAFLLSSLLMMAALPIFIRLNRSSTDL
jgi:MFS family permease